jgi:hypothetical protein
MILEFFLFIILCLTILVFFYKQSTTEFRLAQISDITKVQSLLKEKTPIVVQPLHIPHLWSLQEISNRQTLGNMIVPEFQMQMKDIGQIENAVAPWSPEFAREVAVATGLPVWAEQTLKKLFVAPLYSYRTEVYLGPQGLQKTFGIMTILAVTDGEATATLLNEQSDPYLPVPQQRWKGKLMSALSRDEAPLIGQIQCIDVILRPGTALIIPPHWKYCLEQKEQTCCSVKIVVHHPVSLMMEKVGMRN